MEKLKIGIIGCGGIANGKHLPAIKQNGNFEILAVCDLIEEVKSSAWVPMSINGPPPCSSSFKNTPQVGTALLLIACALP